ncbi:hypothetical protein GCM10012275_53170 [Longimycelium tulufanense]|uniref:Uncharacterized protein n=1 Tax=Longimycelium tulufanense TaxID=907463 RepID=A0A8J3CJ13_9PSEU|nr:hypothetical protein GCM10012275_53170 [Longimycelium tulufanense]
MAESIREDQVELLIDLMIDVDRLMPSLMPEPGHEEAYHKAAARLDRTKNNSTDAEYFTALCRFAS